ncbi:hypothetical protein [Rubritalea tangerina]
MIEDHKRDGILFSLLLLVAFALKYTADLKGGVKMVKPLYFAHWARLGL